MTRISRLPALSTPQRVLLATLALVLFAINAWCICALFTSRAQIAVWDFHPRWLGLRAMIHDGADPYSDQVTLAIQLQMLGRLARPGEDQQAFAYPLHVMVLIGPLALLPLPVAQALWFSLLEVSLLIFFIVAPRAVGWCPPTWLLALTALFTLGLYSNVWAMTLGQISIVLAALIALVWWGLRTGRWRLAGACLALATVKPQMSFLLVPGLLAWAIYRRRWRMVITFVVVFGVLILLPVPWLPAWPLAWLAAVGRYADYTFFEPPLAMLFHSAWLAVVLAALLLLWTVYHWWHAPERQGAALDWALSMLIVVSALVAPRTSHTNQLVLLLPLFFIFTRLPRGGVIAAVEIGLLVGPWLLDWALPPPVTSIPQHGIWQHQVVSPILPVGLALALLCFSLRPVREIDDHSILKSRQWR
jgi:hypothetical protein